MEITAQQLYDWEQEGKSTLYPDEHARNLKNGIQVSAQDWKVKKFVADKINQAINQ